MPREVLRAAWELSGGLGLPQRQLCPDGGDWEAGLSSPTSCRCCGTHTSQRELSTVTSCLALGGRGVGPGSLCAAPGLNFTLAAVLRILRKCFANSCPQSSVVRSLGLSAVKCQGSWDTEVGLRCHFGRRGPVVTERKDLAVKKDREKVKWRDHFIRKILIFC